MPKTWNGEEAAKLVKGPISEVLQKTSGKKRRYQVIEDNGPVGYKSRKALAAKEECKITTVDLPRYSPDLNPLDFYVWSDAWAFPAIRFGKQSQA